jgi:hypothetical protein
VKEQRKYVWKIGYKGGNGEYVEVSVIASGFEALAKWLYRRIWVNKVITISLDKEILELVDEDSDILQLDNN